MKKSAVLGDRRLRKVAAAGDEDIVRLVEQAKQFDADESDTPPEFDPQTTLDDLIRWLQKHAPTDRRTRALTKRLRRIEADIRDLNRAP